MNAPPTWHTQIGTGGTMTAPRTATRLVVPKDEHEDEDRGKELRDPPRRRGPRFPARRVGAEEQGQSHEEPADSDEDQGRQRDRGDRRGGTHDGHHGSADEARQEGDETEDQEAQMLRGRPAHVPDFLAESWHCCPPWSTVLRRSISRPPSSPGPPR